MEVLGRSASFKLAHVALPQLERENARIYLQPVEGDPIRLDLVPGDSVVLTVEER